MNEVRSMPSATSVIVLGLVLVGFPAGNSSIEPQPETSYGIDAPRASARGG